MKRIQQIVNNENHTNGDIRKKFVNPIRIICSFVNSFNISKGFTLIELLLVIAIVAIIFVFSAPYALNFYKSNIINDAQRNIVSALEQAKHNAVLQKNDSNFGVYLAPGGYTLFQTPDSTYGGRDTDQDEVFSLIDEITFATTTVIFSKLSGTVSASSTITLYYSGLSRDILINEIGNISRSN